MSAPEPVAEPGWYPDPFGRLPFRWWDGSQWTGYAGESAVQWDPVPVADEGAATPGLPGIGIALVGVVVGSALSLAISLALEAVDRPGGLAVAVGLSQVGLWTGLITACVVVSRRRGTGSLSRDFAWHVRPRDIGFGLAGSIVARVTAGVVVAPIPSPFFDLRAPDRSVFEDVAVDATGWAILVILVCVGAPLVEELFFRGLLQTRLVDRYGAVPGLVVTALLFGAAHLAAWQGAVTFVYAWSIAGAGLVLGVIRHYTGTLGAATIAHAFFNAQAVVAVALLG